MAMSKGSIRDLVIMSITRLLDEYNLKDMRLVERVRYETMDIELFAGKHEGSDTLYIIIPLGTHHIEEYDIQTMAATILTLWADKKTVPKGALINGDGAFKDLRGLHPKGGR